jgi:hypothetical protein
VPFVKIDFAKAKVKANEDVKDLAKNIKSE